MQGDSGAAEPLPPRWGVGVEPKRSPAAGPAKLVRAGSRFSQSWTKEAGPPAPARRPEDRHVPSTWVVATPRALRGTDCPGCDRTRSPIQPPDRCADGGDT